MGSGTSLVLNKKWPLLAAIFGKHYVYTFKTEIHSTPISVFMEKQLTCLNSSPRMNFDKGQPIIIIQQYLGIGIWEIQMNVV